MTDNLDQRVEAVFQGTLRLPSGTLTDATRRTDLEVWDSLSHILLVDALGKEFGLRIPPELALEMDTVGDVKRILGDLQNSSEH